METLTDNDRAYFAQHMPGDVRSKALRIIDAQAEALTAAKLDAEEWHVSAVAEGRAKLRAEGELRGQEKATQQLSSEVVRLESKLAAASALIGDALPLFHETDRYDLEDRATSLLAGQPMAPRKHDRDDCDNPDCGTCMHNQPVAPARTEAEQRVLDAAMAWHRLDTSVNSEALHHYCAELARRGLK